MDWSNWLIIYSVVIFILLLLNYAIHEFTDYDDMED